MKKGVRGRKKKDFNPGEMGALRSGKGFFSKKTKSRGRGVMIFIREDAGQQSRERKKGK